MPFYIKCEGIGKRYQISYTGNRESSIIKRERFDTQYYQALNNISFELNEGDRLGIIGKNGAGKSTLLKIIGGIIKPSSGKILLKGTSTALLEASSILYEDLNGIDNIFIVGRLLGITKKEIKRQIDEIVKFSEVGTYINQPVKYFSSGMKLRLLISIYKHLQPDILLMDEVLSAGDFGFREKIFETFTNDFSRIPVMIIVSHEMGDILGLCNKCLYLKDGEPIIFGDTGEVLERYSMEHIGRIKKKEIKEKIEIITEKSILPVIKKTSEEIVLSFSITVHEDLEEFKPVFYLNNSKGPVLMDSFVFRKNYTDGIRKGTYRISWTIPPFLLNKGDFYTNCIIETTHHELLGDFSLGKFTIHADDWEKDKLWNKSPKYPLRPKLEWKIEPEN